MNFIKTSALVLLFTFSFTEIVHAAPKKKVKNDTSVQTEGPEASDETSEVPKVEPVPTPKQISFVAHVGFDFGGDTAYTVTYASGSARNVKFGDGIFGSIGALFRIAESEMGAFELQPTFGIKYTTTSASNQDISFTRFPIELLGLYHFSNGLRIGAGIKKDLGPKITADGSIITTSVSPESKLGAVVQADYWFNTQFALGARYTTMKYTDNLNVSRSADCVGVVATFSP